MGDPGLEPLVVSKHLVEPGQVNQVLQWASLISRATVGGA